MRCPKCHYLSFEPEARCRNCGYDLALAEDDLIIKAVDDEDEGLQDFDLHADPHVAVAAPMTLGPLHLEPAAPHETAAAVAVALAGSARRARASSRSTAVNDDGVAAVHAHQRGRRARCPETPLVQSGRFAAAAALGSPPDGTRSGPFASNGRR